MINQWRFRKNIFKFTMPPPPTLLAKRGGGRVFLLLRSIFSPLAVFHIQPAPITFRLSVVTFRYTLYYITVFYKQSQRRALLANQQSLLEYTHTVFKVLQALLAVFMIIEYVSTKTIEWSDLQQNLLIIMNSFCTHACLH